MIREYFDGTPDQQEKQSFITTIRRVKDRINEVEDHHTRLFKEMVISHKIASQTSDLYGFLCILNLHLDSMEAIISKSVKWEGLFNELHASGYISTTKDIFTHAMEYQQLPGGSKIKWLRSKSDAMYFCDRYNFKLPEFNKCFIHKDGKSFAQNNRTDSNPRPPLPDILKNFSIQ